MTPSPRKPRVRNACLGIGLACVILPVLYVLSYAPVYRWQANRQNQIFPVGPWRAIYDPVDWMMDKTPLRRPLLAWAEFWGIRSSFETDMHFRWTFGHDWHDR
jgi:hypothetical protein